MFDFVLRMVRAARALLPPVPPKPARDPALEDELLMLEHLHKDA